MGKGLSPIETPRQSVNEMLEFMNNKGFTVETDIFSGEEVGKAILNTCSTLQTLTSQREGSVRRSGSRGISTAES